MKLNILFSYLLLLLVNCSSFGQTDVCYSTSGISKHPLWKKINSDPLKAFLEIEVLLKDQEFRRDSAYYTLLILRGQTLMRMNETGKAVNDLLNAQDYFKSNLMYRSYAKTSFHLFQIHKRAFNTQRMIKVLQELELILDKLPEEMKFEYTLNQISYLMHSKKLQSAKHLLKKIEEDSTKFYYEADYDCVMQSIAMKLSSIYLQEGKLDSARYYLSQTSKLCKDRNNNYQTLFSQFTYAKIYTKEQRYQKAITVLKNISVPNNSSIRSTWYYTLAGTYEKMGDYKNAHLHFKQFTRSRDSIRHKKTNKIINEVYSKFQDEKKEVMIKGIRKNQQFSERKYLTSVLLGIIVVIALFFYIRVQRLKTKQLNIIVAKEEFKRKSIENLQLLQQSELEKKHLSNQALNIEKEKQELKFKEEKAARENLELVQESILREKEQMQKELSIQSLHLVERAELLTNLEEGLKHLKKELSSPKEKTEIQKLIKDIKQQKDSEANWNEFEEHFSRVYGGFYDNLIKAWPNLTNKDLRLCALLRMRLSSKEIATILGMSVGSIDVARSRIRKKMGLKSSDSLTSSIISAT